MTPYTFGIVGGGWRAETFVRIAQRLPEQFHCLGVVVRNPEKRVAFGEKWNVPLFADTAELIHQRPNFGVSSVSWDSNPGIIREFANAHIPVLAETPPAKGRAEMEAMMDLAPLGARIQVAEQVALRPIYQAVKAAIHAGIVGEVHHVQVSVAHGYHGISLLEELLGVVEQSPEVRAVNTPDISTQGPGRYGGPDVERISRSGQTVAWLQYPGEKFGVFDFTGNQYFSHIRKSRILVRGSRGEIDFNGARWLTSFDTPVEAEFKRRGTGLNDDLGPESLEGITLGEHWRYRNPFYGSSMQDDEIAMSTLMLAVAEGREIYSLKRAMHDHALSLTINQAAESGQPTPYLAGPWNA